MPEYGPSLLWRGWRAWLYYQALRDMMFEIVERGALAMHEPQSQHVKQIRIDQRLVVDLFNGMANRQYFYLPKVEGLPEGTVVLSVKNCWERRCLLALVEHPSFPDVPYGMSPPIDEEIWIDAIERKDLAQECAAAELAIMQEKIDNRERVIDGVIAALGTHYNHRETLANTIARLVALLDFHHVKLSDKALLVVRGQANPELIDDARRLADQVKLPVAILGDGESIETLTDVQLEAIGLHRQQSILAAKWDEKGMDMQSVLGDLKYAEWTMLQSMGIPAHLYRGEKDEAFGVAVGDSEPCDDGTELVQVRIDPAAAAVYQELLEENGTPPDELASPSDNCPDCKGRGTYIGLTVEEACQACGGTGKVRP